jgi:hypothetical protein
MRDIEKVQQLLQEAHEIAERIARETDLKLREYGRVSLFETVRLERAIKDSKDHAEEIAKMSTYQETIRIWVMKDMNGEKIPQQVDADLYSDGIIAVREPDDNQKQLLFFSRASNGKWHGWEVDDTKEGLLEKFIKAQKSSLIDLQKQRLALMEKESAMEQLINKLENKR